MITIQILTPAQVLIQKTALAVYDVMLYKLVDDPTGIYKITKVPSGIVYTIGGTSVFEANTTTPIPVVPFGVESGSFNLNLGDPAGILQVTTLNKAKMLFIQVQETGVNPSNRKSSGQSDTLQNTCTGSLGGTFVGYNNKCLNVEVGANGWGASCNLFQPNFFQLITTRLGAGLNLQCQWYILF